MRRSTTAPAAGAAFLLLPLAPLAPVLAVTADYHNPLFWAVFVGWIMSVVLHEFAHGLVASLGGDYTIRERGGLSLNPLQYVDPVMSLALPAVVLLIGGIPLPGGVNYIRRDLLRNRFWESAMSLAGPAMNFLIFLACALPLHPRFHWVDPWAAPDTWLPAQRMLATTAVLQLIAVFLNLVPVPPLDGFQALGPFMNPETRHKLSTPPLSNVLFFGFFILVWQVPAVYARLFGLVDNVFRLIGFDGRSRTFVHRAFNMTMFGMD